MHFEVLSLGLTSYLETYQLQREILEDVVQGDRPSTLLLTEHHPVLTLGAAYEPANLLLPIDAYRERGIEVIQSDRGGDVTYHGPGQLVAYPIFSLEPWGKDLHRWLRFLEEVVIQTLPTWGIESGRNPVNTGVWVGNRKICAMGIKVRRWVSMHGLALNCDIDLIPYQLFVPCGIRGDYGVTSITAETGQSVSVECAACVLVDSFQMAQGTLPTLLNDFA